ENSRDNYLAKMEWIGGDLAIQSFNRLQNENTVFLVLPGAKEPIPFVLFKETERTWVENNNEFRWIEGGKKFLWLSERDGWRHLYLATVKYPSEGAFGSPAQITKGNFDVISIEAIDEKRGHIYFIASPDNPTQRYL